MFTGSPVASINDANALSTDDINMYQAAGALTIAGTMGACTIGGLIVAPAPVAIALGGGVGLAMFGHKFTEGKDADKADSKSEAKADAPAKPVAGTVVAA